MNANLKVVLLDTNVILLNSKCIYDFTDTDLVIPSSVIAELDNFKKNEGENGYNSREFMRDLDEKSAGQSLKDGIRINETTTLKIMNQSDFINPKDVYADNDIIAIAKNIKQVNPDKNVVICSNDINLRVRASTLGLIAERYEVDCPKEREEKEEYIGYKTFNLTEIQADDDLYLDENVFVDSLKDKYVYLNCTENKKKSSLYKYSYKENQYNEIKCNFTQYKLLNVCPKSVEQMIAYDMLCDDEIKLVMIGGRAGSGKTLCAMVCCMHQLIQEKYELVYISKSTVPTGGEKNNIGFLKGTMAEKLEPYTQSFMDAIRFIKVCDVRSGKSQLSDEVEKGIEFLPMAYTRGRSLNNCAIIIDEAQNLTLSDLKTLITRAGENSKIILLSDVEQIDAPYLDKNSNGFAKVARAFKNQTIASYIKFVKCERSKLADIASKIL